MHPRRPDIPKEGKNKFFSPTRLTHGYSQEMAKVELYNTTRKWSFALSVTKAAEHVFLHRDGKSRLAIPGPIALYPVSQQKRRAQTSSMG